MDKFHKSFGTTLKNLPHSGQKIEKYCKKPRAQLFTPGVASTNHFSDSLIEHFLERIAPLRHYYHNSVYFNKWNAPFRSAFNKVND